MMKLSTPALTSILENPAYKALPNQLVMEASSQAPWWSTVEQLVQTSAKQLVWEAATCMALLFDTYPGVMEEVGMQFDRTDDGYIYIHIEINGYECFNGVYGMGKDVKEVYEAIDGLKTFEFVVNRLDDMGNNYLLPALNMFQSAFDKPVESAEQAREIASTHAPVVDAWVRKYLLQQHVPAGLGKAPQPRGM